MRIIIVLLVFVTYTLLFQKAAGTLRLERLNMISYAYYLMLVFCFIGASLVFIGFRDHYLIEKVSNETIDKTYAIIIYTLIAFPAAICLFNRFFGIFNMKKTYENKITSGFRRFRSDEVWIIIAILSFICLIAMIYVFSNMGFFPLLELFRESSDQLAQERVQITRGFSGNIYIRNIVMLALTPILSYMAYLYMRITKEMKWKVLFAVLFIASVIIKTYNFEKSPVVYYIFYFYVLEILLGNIKNLKFLFAIAVCGVIIILFFYYFISGYEGKLFTISSGPGGRIFVTQIATLFLHVQVFPNTTPYLHGTSLPTVLATLCGLDEGWVRSGRIVMEVINPAGIANGTAGVMNSLFVGEAYANWGMMGVILAPIYIGFLYSLIHVIFLKNSKTPMLLIGYLIIFINFSQSLLGGFVDYVYPVASILLIFIVVGIGIISNRGIILIKERVWNG